MRTLRAARLPPDANGRSGGLADGRPGLVLSPVSHCAHLGTLHHGSASPGSANPPATARVVAPRRATRSRGGDHAQPARWSPPRADSRPPPRRRPSMNTPPISDAISRAIRSTGGLTVRRGARRPARSSTSRPSASDNPTNRRAPDQEPREPTTTDSTSELGRWQMTIPDSLADRSRDRARPRSTRSIEHRSTTPPLSIPRSPLIRRSSADLRAARGARREAQGRLRWTSRSSAGPDGAAAAPPDGFLPTPRAGVGTFDAPPASVAVGTHMPWRPAEVSACVFTLEGPRGLPAETDKHGLPCVTPEVAARVLSRCAAGTMRAHFHRRSVPARGSARVTFAAR